MLPVTSYVRNCLVARDVIVPVESLPRNEACHRGNVARRFIPQCPGDQVRYQFLFGHYVCSTATLGIALVGFQLQAIKHFVAVYYV